LCEGKYQRAENKFLGISYFYCYIGFYGMREYGNKTINNEVGLGGCPLKAFHGSN
jgi:hypothetical protein